MEMETSENQKRGMNIRWFLLRLMLVLYDIFTVNFAYFAALVIRFYVNFEINAWAVRYIPAFIKFTPYYTVCCIVVFSLFKLYNSRWKYAGINDMNRIFTACLVTSVIQVAGSWLFVLRMPLTYYFIGSVIQFAMILASRFAFRFFLMERDRVRKRKNGTAIPVMIVGVGETSHIVLKHLERDVDNTACPVCIVDFRGDEMGDMIEGLPVIRGIDRLTAAVQKYAVENVILADTTMPQKIRKEIRELCAGLGVDVQDFSGFYQDARGSVTLRNLMEYTSGEVELVINGRHQVFSNGEQAVMSVTGKYVVKSVSGQNNRLVVELQKDILVLNDVKEEWVQSYQKETGEDISFF